MAIKKYVSSLALILALSSCATTGKGGNGGNNDPKREMHDYSVYDEGVPFDNSLWTSPEYYFDESLDNEGNKALYIRSDYNGQESYAFAYLALPEGELINRPAVLLLHGGGGSAYYEWSNAWAKRGYVALAIDLEGHVPNASGKITDYPTDLYHTSTYPAPHNSNLNDENDDLSLTWLHYACRTAIIANSFLHHLDGVDPYSIGVSGVSWGGFITSIITGYDDRFAFSAPIYCTVQMKESGTPIGSYIKNHPKFTVFDMIEPLSLINTPVRLTVSDVDQHENVVTAGDVVDLIPNGQLAIINGLLHSHAHALALEEPFAFADEVLEGKEEFRMKWNSNEELELTLAKGKEARLITLYSTTEESVNSTTRWTGKEVSIEKLKNNKISISLREGTTYYYLSIIDEKGVTHTSSVKLNSLS